MSAMSTDPKPGSQRDAVTPSDSDFGVHAGDKQAANYVSEETRRNDPGKAPVRSGIGPRDSGVGGYDVGPGSSSGGDIDVGGTSLTGVGDPHQKPHEHGSEAADTKTLDPLDTPVVMSGQQLASGSSTSADGMNNETQHNNEGFKGDVTMDEASGNSSN